MKCRICDNAEGNLKFKAKEWMYGSGEIFPYFLCAKCGCLQIQEFPSDMSKYYGPRYYSFQARRKGNPARRALVRLRNHYAIFNHGFIGKLLYEMNPTSPTAAAIRSLHFFRPTRNDHILEVGSGSGILLDALAELGFENILGLDPFIDAEHGRHVKKLYIHEVEGSWDLIMFHHSFEHVPDPKDTLRSVNRLLKPGGQCLIRIPTVSSYAWKHYGMDWVQLDAPRHFFLYSHESMAMLAHETGFELVDIVCDSNSFQFWGSEQIKKGIALLDERSYEKNPEKSLFPKQMIEDFEKRAKALNEVKEGDQAAFYLRRFT